MFNKKKLADQQKQLDKTREIIEDQEKQIEALVDKVADMIKSVENAKTSANEVLELLDYSSEDSVILNIVNFLNEQGNTEAAKIIGKCKLGKILAKQGRSWLLEVTIPIICTGDAYNVLSSQKNNSRGKIEEAFTVYFSEYYFKSKGVKMNHGTSMNWIYYNYKLSMKHIEPKESDLELFFDKVDKLKKLTSKK